MENYVVTWDFNRIKEAQQEPHVMFRDSTRSEVTIYPSQQLSQYKSQNPLQFEFYAKNFYHFINFNKAILQGEVCFEFDTVAPILNENSVNITLPWNAISIFDSYSERIGDVLLEQSAAYGKKWAIEDYIRCEKDLVDGPTWRCPARLLPAIPDPRVDDITFTKIVSASRLVSIAGDWLATRNNITIKVLFQIPIVTQLENAGWFPIYQMADAIKMEFRFLPFDQIFNIKWNTLTSMPTVYYQNFRLDCSVLRVNESTVLTTSPYSWQSVSYDYFTEKVPLSGTNFTEWVKIWESRWRNTKSILQIVQMDGDDVDNYAENHGIDALEVEGPFSMSLPAPTEVLFSWNGYNYPNQVPINTLLQLWRLWLEYNAMYDDNGITKNYTVDFDKWLASGSFFGVDLSTLTQAGDIISGLNTKDARLMEKVKIPVCTNPREVNIRTYINRNVLFILEGGGIAKLE